MPAQLFRRYGDRTPFWLVRHLVNLWPPFMGAGIRVLEAKEDYSYLKVELRRSWFNSNYVGTRFGGSIYAMVDPFYMLMLMNRLGKEFIVWDKAAQIDFIKPGRSKLFAEFIIHEDLIGEILSQTQSGSKFIFDLPVDIYDEQSVKIARVVKTLYVRKKVVKNRI